ncbi:MAG: hypothetical protein O6945_03795 [Gammaproteobacteria bacterium]|nr:hypothetical protein [Gammaproteobacteria bacterium]
MIKERVVAVLKFFVVDSVVNIMGDLFEQPPIMWAFIGWGWLSILVMLTSVFQTMSQI